MYLAVIFNERNEFVILTQEASEVMKPVHDRQPVILDDEEVLKYIKDYGFAAKIIKKQKVNFNRSANYNNASQFINN